MDDEKLNKFIASTNEQIVIFGGHIASLRASVTVLKFALAGEMNHDHPEKALALFARLEKQFLDSDPNEQQRKEIAEMIEAVKLSRKHGGTHEA
jgi:hypothetical protein